MTRNTEPLSIEQIRERVAEYDAAQAVYDRVDDLYGPGGEAEYEKDFDAAHSRWLASLRAVWEVSIARLALAQAEEVVRLREALTELVELKALKDSLGHGEFEEYKRRQPLAWQAARAALAQPAKVQP